MPSIVLYQAKEYSQYIHFNTAMDWTVHRTPYSYMGRYGWLKSMTQFSNVCGASPVNKQILFFDGYGSHFDGGALRQVMGKKPNPLYWKKSTTSTTSSMTMAQITNWILSRMSLRVRGCWSMGRQKFYLATWTLSQLKHGMPSRCQMETLSWADLRKQCYPPLSPPNLTINTQAFAASIQVSPGAKAC